MGDKDVPLKDYTASDDGYMGLEKDEPLKECSASDGGYMCGEKDEHFERLSDVKWRLRVRRKGRAFED